MPSKRSLPKRRNPLLEEEHTPAYEILTERRRLGQTKLDVAPGVVNKINATSPSNLGNFDYAHLRVPLPKDLEGSGIFFAQNNSMYPESYFLMRRSTDGFLSATGMFKAAFPWASKEEEAKERTYHKKLSSSGPDEVAGNVWISPEEGLDLADEYSMRAWIEALLDPQPIEKGTKDSNATIATPPRFKLPGRDESFPVPQLSASTMRKRELRSASPGKAGTTPAGRKIASPRKRKTKAQKEAEAQSPAKAASSALRNAVENGAPESSVEPTPSAASDTAKEDTIQVEVQETSEVVDGVETTHTNVKVVMPADNPDLELPTDAEGVIEKAHEIAETARKLQESKGKSLKRKADDMEDEEEVTSEPLAVQPVKKQRVLEDQLKKERVKARALIGITATLAIGAMVPYFL